MISKTISRQILTVGEGFQPPLGGISSVLSTYSNHFSDFKFVATYNLQISKISNVFYFALSLIKLSGKLLTDSEIKIVHIHGAHYGSFYRKFLVFLVGKLFGKKLIYHSHGSDFHIFYNNANPLTRKLIQIFFRNIDLVICLSKQWKTFFEANFKLKNIIVLENIIDPADSSLPKERSQHLRLLFLGFIGERKGIFDLLEVIKNNKEYFNDKLELTIGGNGETKKLEAFIKEYQLENIVKFKGWISGEDKKALLQKSDVYILPSYNEGLPISILEAMSHSMPIISTSVGGISEILTSNVNGFLVKPGDSEAILSSIKAFINNPDLIDAMGRKSRQMVTPYYSNSVIPKLESVYKQMLTV
ncbi:glycosyltransferase family 4 protein [Dyadobacter sp. CY326]|uniref:glycosyltransferase family 4 protein n=1 Tax=Dyadobacter sp. CY326 TaxID=2907300 RepID=UPI001F1FCC69|nr:glycosyltransferase family 4 protein [Dyadobacter sp. CY326]MCE7066594.1 glycosyltransferase family 4 protein [Dyadobacter sp. CY326]